MRSSAKRFAPAVLSVATLLAACNGDPTTTSPLAPSARTSQSVGAVTCNIAGLRTDAALYVGSSSDAIYPIIDALETASANGPSNGATERALDALARLSFIRGSSAQRAGSTPAQGGQVALDLLSCMQANVTSALPTLANLTKAMDVGGLFAVRGGVNDAANGGVFSTGATVAWGVQPQTPATWRQSSGNTRFLLYGWPIASAALDPSVAPNGFDFNTIPAGLTFNPMLVVGTCVQAAGGAHIQHIGTVLPIQPFDCTTLTTASAEKSSMSRVLAAIGNLIAPKAAYAKMFLAGGMGGLSGSFSPYYAIDAKNTKLSFVGQPRDSYVNVNVPGSDNGLISILVTTAGGTPLGNAAVTLAVYGNNGSWIVSGVQATTDANGIATFPAFKVTKAGGYRLTASGTWDNLTGPDAPQSEMFHIKNKAP